jgi:hypothetical protein
MITDENKYEVIDAYLLGLLNEAGRQEVEQKMADDPNFYTEVVLQEALLSELDRQETNDTNQLIDQLLAEEIKISPDQTDDEPDTDIPVIPIGRDQQRPWWQQNWQKVAAGVVLVLGVGWFGYRVASPPTVTASISYQQQVFGGFGTDSLTNTSPFPVTFIQKLFGALEYENGPAGLRLYLTTPPGDPKQWLLTDDATTGGFQLRAPDGTTYPLQPNTAGERKPLTK